MAIRVQRHVNVRKQATLLDVLDVSPLKWRVCGLGLNRFVHKGMNHISNIKVHLKTRSGNVNIYTCTYIVLITDRIKVHVPPSCLVIMFNSYKSSPYKEFYLNDL